MPTISTLTVDVDANTTKATSKLGALGSGMVKAGKAATVGLTLPIVAAGVAAFKMADDYNDATATIAQHIKTMGARGTVSLDGITKAQRNFAEATGDSVVELLNASGKLVTFANVAKRGTGFINEATEASADLAASGFGSVTSASVMLGKALDNPIKGLTALTRVGVSFTDQQAKVITKLVETGQTAKAQGMILEAVQAQVGGTAKKIADPWDKAKAVLSDVAITIGNDLAPIVASLARIVEKAFKWFEKLSPSGQRVVEVMFGIAAAAGPVLIIFGKMATAVNALTGQSGSLGKGLKSLTDRFGGLAVAAGAAEIAIGVYAATSSKWEEQTKELAREVVGAGADLVDLGRAAGLTGKTFVQYATAVADADAITKKEAREVARAMGAFEAIRQPIDDVTAAQVHNLLAMGDASGALKVLSNLYDRYLGPLHRAKDTIGDVAERQQESNLRMEAGIALLRRTVPKANASTTAWRHMADTLGDVAQAQAEANAKMAAGIALLPHTGHGGSAAPVPPGGPTLQHGGTVARTGWALVHEGERFSGVGGGGWGNVTVNVYGSVMTERDLAVTIQKALLKDKRRSGSLGLS